MERRMIEQPKLRDLKPEEHGPVIEIRSDYSSHGMSMGSSSYGKETHEKYLAGSEAAERKLDCGSYWDVQRKAVSKIRDLIKECIDSGKSMETWICPQCNTENKGKYYMECGRKRDA